MVGNNPNSLTVASPISRLSNIPTDKAPKFIRSKDRCHIIVRTPIYDAKGNLLAYNFRYTAGEGSFRPDELQRKHVKHVLIGFYIRRHIEQFTQYNALAMTELPLSPEITKFSKPIPANRFILHLQDRQDSSASYQHQVNKLKRDTMTIAADAYTIVYTNWFRELRSISYAVIDMTKDVEEQFILAKNIVKKAPWIKIICDRCDNQNLASIAFEAGADYVCCPTFSKDIIKKNLNPYHFKANRLGYDKILAVILELLEDRPNYDLFLNLISMRNDIKVQIPFLLDFLQSDITPDYIYTDIESSLYDIDTETLHKLICIICLMLLEEFYMPDAEKVHYMRFEPVKQILIRAKCVEELLTYKSGEVDVSWGFTVGLSTAISSLYAYTNNIIDELLTQIEARLMVLFDEQPVIDTACKIAKSLDSLDLEYIDGVMMADVFGRHDILFSYENAITWTSSFVTMMNQKRY